MFLNHLYGGMDEPELKIIDVFICKLRKKLAEATGGDNYIETVWGRGAARPGQHAGPACRQRLIFTFAGPPPNLVRQQGAGMAETAVAALTEAEARQELSRLAQALADANTAYHTRSTRPRFLTRSMTR